MGRSVSFVGVILLAALVGATSCEGGGASTTASTTTTSSGASSASGMGGDGGAAVSFSEEERAALASLSPETLPDAPPDPTNAWADDPGAVALGKQFFFTPSFSGELLDGDENGGPGTLGHKGEVGRVSCASCHVAEDGFSDTRSPSAQISLGSGWGRRRAPSLLDVGQEKLLMWDGRRDALYNQVFGPFESAVEMNASRLFVAEQVYAHFKADYESVFGPLPPLDDAARFPPLAAADAGCQALDAGGQCATGAMRGAPGDGAEFDGLAEADKSAVTRVVVNVGKAIGAYERRLTCGQGRFDRFVHGEVDAMTPAEQRGAKIFVGEGRCIPCHGGPHLTDHAFHVVGLAPATVAAAFIDSDDHGAAVGLSIAMADPLNSEGAFSDGSDGRLPASVASTMEGAFRTPGLRCVAMRPSFFHTGQIQSLAAVVDFFAAGGHVGGYPGVKEIVSLPLDAQAKADLVAFLGALDGPGPDASLTHP